jgi:ribulose-5-phosphate 4-epimerase/fuculose-1-phosphate aldolase
VISLTDIPIPSAGPVDAAVIDDLVAASRILAQNGVLDAWGHVSIRHPANPERYLLSRARAPALVSAEDILEFDLDSNPVDPRGQRVFLERFIHGQAYRARPDVNAVVHSHSPTMIPFSVTGEPLKAISHIASFLVQEVPVWEIRDVGITEGLLVTNNRQGHSLAKTLGDGPVALMRGHGNLVVARIPAAWVISMFYQARLDWIRMRDKFKHVLVIVRASNEASQRACRNFGFACIGRAPRTWPDGTTEDEMVYELRLKMS